jgi:hypothetical protein
VLGEQYVSNDSDDILFLSPLVFPLRILPHFPVTLSFFLPFPPPIYTQSYLNILAVSSWLGDYLWNMIIRNSFCLAANLSVHICKSEDTNVLPIHLCIDLMCFYFLPPSVYTHSFCDGRYTNYKDLVLYMVLQSYKTSLGLTSHVCTCLGHAHTHTHTHTHKHTAIIFHFYC